MKPKSALVHFLALAGSSLLAVSSAHAQSTYTWSNANVTPTTTPSTLNWINATQATWTGGTPVSNNLNTIQFFDNNVTALTNTAAATQASVLDNGSAFQLGTLTLSGLASATTNANLTMNLSGDALNFSAATGRINLDALNATRTITYNVANNIQLGTASSGSVLTIAGAGGSAFNLNGIISELQTGGGSLVKTGTSTVSLTGANTFTGSTTINGGNVTLSGASGSLASTSIALNGGGLTLNNSSTTGNSGNRISNSATITANGSSALTFSHNSASGIDYSETIGTLSLQSGSFTYTGSQANNTGPRSSNVLFNTLSRSGTATANFAGTGLGTNGQNTIKFGSGVTADADLGPWAVVNGTVFAYYGATNGVTAGTSSTLAASSNSATTNFNSNGGDITLDASLNPSLKTLLINSTTARTVSLNGNTVSVGGISAASNTNNIVHTINGTGALQALNAGDALYVNFSSTNSGSSLKIDSNIQNYNGGTTGSALIKYGAGNVTVNGAVNISGGLVVNAGTLVLNNADNSITGGFTLNGGSLLGISTATHDNNNITVNASSFLGMANGATTDGTITLNAGSILSLGTNNNAATFNGAVTGAGSIAIDRLGLGGNTISLNSTGNTFTGNILFTAAGARTLNINSLTDTTTLGAGNIRFSGPTATFALGSGAVAPLTLNNRQFEFLAGAFTIANDSSQTFTVNSDLLIGISGGSASLGLAGTGSGLSSFNGKIENRSLTSLGLTKSGGGTWVLGNNANTYTGVTTISAGTLSISKMANYTANSSIGQGTAGTAIAFGGGALVYTGAGDNTDRLVQTSGGNGTILNNGLGALNFTATGNFNTQESTTTARTLTLGGTNGGTISGGIQNNNSGTIALTKMGTGTWTLGGTNTYTGATSVNGGTLELLQTGTNTLTQSLAGALTNGLGEGTLISNRSGTSGSITTTFGSYSRTAGATGNIVSTGGTNGTDNSVNITGGSQGFIDRGLFFGGSEYAARSATGGFVRALIYGTDPTTATTATANNHVKLTSSYSGAGMALLSLNLQGSGVGWTNASSNLTTPGILKSGGGSQSTISGGNVTTTSNAELVIRTDSSSDSLLISSNLTQGTGGLTKSGAGTLTLTGTNTYSGITTVNAGTLEVSSTGSIASTSGITINTGGELKYGNNAGLARNVTLSGGTFRYNATTAYSGTLSYNSGTLAGTNLTGAAFNGQVIGATKSISPGNSPGTMTVGDQTWAAGGTYFWELYGATGTAGNTSGWDLLSGTGTLNITASAGSEFIIDLTTLASLSPDVLGDAINFNSGSSYSWLIAEFATVTGFNTTDFTIDAAGFDNAYTGNFGLSWTDGATDKIFLNYTAIPEPRAALLGGLGLLMLLRRRR